MTNPRSNHEPDTAYSAESATPSRRKLLTGAAWTVPVIATAMSTPAFAASAPCIGTFSFSPTTTTAGTTRFVANTAYSSPLTITKTGGLASATVRLTLTGPGFTFDDGTTVKNVTFVGGSTTVYIVASTATGAGNLAVQGIAQTQTCPITNIPLARRTLTYESSFGIGYYSGLSALQIDAQASDSNRYHRIVGTNVGDVITNVHFETGITDGWPATPAFTRLSGSNPNWTALTATGATFQALAGGVNRTFRVYRSTYTAAITATAGTTSIPINFFQRQSPVTFAANQFGRTTRHAVVSGTPVTQTRAVAAIVSVSSTPPSP